MVAMRGWVIRLVPVFIAAMALLLLLRTLLIQAALQSDLNQAMQGVLWQVGEAGRLTDQTADALAPLHEISETMSGINRELEQTSKNLVSMNEALQQVSGQQQEVLQRLKGLSNQSRGVVESLDAIDAWNRTILGTITRLSSETGRQAEGLKHLAGLTDEAADGLGRLNRRFAFLKRL